MSEELLHRIEDRVAIITMNRPERRNAMSRNMLMSMIDVLQELSRNPDVGCIVLTGAEGAFCSGGDVKDMSAQGGGVGGGASATLEDATARLRHGMEASAWLHEILKPTIAMINGPAAGAGLSLALSCDLRYMAKSTILTTAFINVGFSGDYGGSYFLSKMIGNSKARELYYLSERLSADRAYELGIVNNVFEDSELKDKTMAIARQIAHGPSVAYRYMKRNFNAAEYQPMRECFELEAAHHARTGYTEDHRNAAKAFTEKRKPTFVGR